MVEVISVYTRPEKTIEWHDPMDLSPDLKAKYSDARVLETILNSDTQLIVRTTFTTEQAYSEFMSEPEVVDLYATITEYHESVGIISDPKIVTVL